MAKGKEACVFRWLSMVITACFVDQMIQILSKSTSMFVSFFAYHFLEGGFHAVRS